MPHFLDEFFKEVESKRGELLRSLALTDEKLRLYEEVLLKHWHPIPPYNSHPSRGRAYGVDSSDGIIRCKGGTLIHICRSIAVGSAGLPTLSRLSLVPLVLEGGDDELAIFRGMMREHLEHLVALEALKLLGEGDVIFLDGSLYSRLTHIPSTRVLRELRVAGFEDFPLQYLESYERLLVESRNKGVILVGVSKDSRSRILKKFLLRELLRSRLNEESAEKLKRLLEEEGLRSLEFDPTRGGTDIQRLVEQLWDRIETEPKLVAHMRELIDSGELPSWMREVMDEALYPRNDVQIVLWYLRKSRRGRGYTSPLLLGRHRVHDVLFSHRSGKLKDYVRKRFKRAISRKGEGVVERALRTVSLLFKAPTIISFYLALAEDEEPFRVDVPAWVLGRETELECVKGFGRAEVDEGRLKELISKLLAFYAGPSLRHGNVLLEAADKRVKLRRKVLRDVYKRFLERRLGLPIEAPRSERGGL